MADKLIYKGGARVVGHTGGEMQLVQPKKGPLHRFPRWWNRKGTVAYVDAAIFKVTLDSGLVVRLVVPATVGAHTLEIRHDGYGNFTFPVKNGVDRVAVVAESGTQIYREYQFAKISGGSVLTRTLNPYPAPEVTGSMPVAAPEPFVVPKSVIAPEPVVESEPEPETAPKPVKKKKAKVKIEIEPKQSSTEETK